MKKLLLILLLLMSGGAFASGGGDGHGGGGGGAGDVVKMDVLIINLQGGRYINFVTQLKLVDPVDEAYVKGYMPVIRHEMIKSLIGRDPATVQSTEFISTYSQKVAEGLNKLLDGEYIKDVFFDTWMLR